MKWLAILFIVVSGIFIFLRASKRANPANVIEKDPQKGKIYEFSDKEKFIECITKNCVELGYEIALSSDSHLVFSDKIGLFSFGFFYAIAFDEVKTNQVKVGIYSRTMQVGPIVTNRFNKFDTILRECID